MIMRGIWLAATLAGIAFAQDYDFLIKNGHVIDGKNHLSAVRDVALKDGKVAAVAANIPASRALKTVDATGLYVTPGLVDIHVHVFPGLKHATYDGGDWGVYPDGFTLRVGVTTVADAGSSGWRSFDDFKKRIIDTQKTRVLAFLNVVGVGMSEGGGEQNQEDMDVQPAIDVVNKNKGTIIGIKSAHYAGPGWKPYISAEAIGKATNIPVMVDFGSNLRNGRTINELFQTYFRPGDIYTHCYGGHRGEQDAETKGPSQAFIDGRKKGVIFDVGHGGGSFIWSCAIPLMKAGFIPDSISTDLHASSMNAGMHDMLNVMDKFLALGMSLDEVILRSTWNPAHEIKHDELGNLSVGSPADVAVLRLETGHFGFTDQTGARFDGTQKLLAELTLRDGKVVYDLNGMTREQWDKIPEGARGGDPRWDGFARAGGPAGRGGAGAGRGGNQKGNQKKQ
jgi:dihydroorotase